MCDMTCKIFCWVRSYFGHCSLGYEGNKCDQVSFYLNGRSGDSPKGLFVPSDPVS